MTCLSLTQAVGLAAGGTALGILPGAAISKIAAAALRRRLGLNDTEEHNT